jgi:NAD(P)-dependent dehydrogenase (short-subunit alcohol dehydrogenase family)
MLPLNDNAGMTVPACLPPTVTGGDSGIGCAVAIAFAREGADVAISYYNEHEDAKETMRWVEQAGRRALAIDGDLRDPKHCQSVVERTVRDFGGINILVNNAAVHFEVAGFEEITPEQLDQTFRTNIYAYFYMAQAARCDHQHRLGGRHDGSPDPAGLRRHKGRHSQLHSLVGVQAGGSGHPGELRCSWTGMDTSHSGNPRGGASGGARRRRTLEAARPASRARTELCVPGFR